MDSDPELLRRYVEDRSEPAFAELVRRHLNLVYFAALRQVGGDTHRAQDVAQRVFTDLARKARTLARHATLTGWLYTSTRYAAMTLRRAEANRTKYEQEVENMRDVLSGSEPAADWERLRPLIDDALLELSDRDREAVLLRFFQGRAFAEIGTVLNVSEDGARMRVERALDKLRTLLGRRGVDSTTAALAVIFANQVAAQAPAGLATAITGVALASATTGGATTIAGVFMSHLSTIAASAIALAAIGTTFFQWQHAQSAQVDLAAVSFERDSLRAQLSTEQQRTARLKQEGLALRGELDGLKTKQATPAPAPRAAVPAPVVTANEPQRLSQAEAVMNNLRQISASVDRFALERGRPPTSLDELVGEGKFIKRLVSVAGEDYAGLALVPGSKLSLTLPNGDSVSAGGPAPEPSPERRQAMELRAKLMPALKNADAAYRAANGGKTPPSPEAMLPYFATPQEGADFVEYLELQKAARAK